jgi:hypothetical protein
LATKLHKLAWLSATGLKFDGKMRKVRGRTLGLSLGCWLCGAAGLGAVAGGCAPRDAAGVVLGNDHGSLVQLDVSYTRVRSVAASASPADDDARLEAEAHFIRYRIADPSADPTIDARAVAALLGLGDDDSLPIDACRSDDRTDRLLQRAQGPGALEVALLDAGTLALGTRSGNERAQVAAMQQQRYPELFPFVSGVVYAEELTPAPVLPPGAQLEVEAAGGEDVGPFVAGAPIPASFPALIVSRDQAGGALQLAWGGPAEPARADASVLIDLRWSGTQAGALRCRARDDGRFTIDAARLVALDLALAAGDKAQVSVARSERAPVEAPGAGPGTLTVTLRDTVQLEGQ